MWNIKKSSESEEVVAVAPKSSSSRGMFMNPYELTMAELVRKIKFFSAYIAGIVVLPKLLRSIGLIEPLGVPLTRR